MFYVLINLTSVWRRVNVRDNVIYATVFYKHYHSLLQKKKKNLTVEMAQSKRNKMNHILMHIIKYIACTQEQHLKHEFH